MVITRIDGPEARNRIDELAALLRNAVEHGASMGFVLPLQEEEVRAYWASVFVDIDAGKKRLFIATASDGSCHGTAQLALEMRSNGLHRAEVQKVIVRHSARGAGVGAALMSTAEADAKALGRSLLFLDTSVGPGGAVRFYEQIGYRRAGGIPGYAMDPDGRLADNTIFYKRI